MAWTPKLPAEVDNFVIDWSARLGGDETIGDGAASSVVEFIAQAGLVKDADSHDGTTVTVMLSAGNDGSVGEIRNTIITSAGRTLIETRCIIIGRPAELADYENPTIAHLLDDFPEFQNAPDSLLVDALRKAREHVDETWSAHAYANAQTLYAAHLLTLSGAGSGSEAVAFASDTAGFQTIKSASLTLTRSSEAAGALAGRDLGATSYGRRFRQLRQINFAGPRVIRGNVGDPAHPAAQDI